MESLLVSYIPRDWVDPALAHLEARQFGFQLGGAYLLLSGFFFFFF